MHFIPPLPCHELHQSERRLALLPAILQNQGNGLRQAHATLLDSPSLAVSSRDFRTKADVPAIVVFDYCSEFVWHRAFLWLGVECRSLSSEVREGAEMFPPWSIP